MTFHFVLNAYNEQHFLTLFLHYSENCIVLQLHLPSLYPSGQACKQGLKGISSQALDVALKRCLAGQHAG